MSQPTTLGSLAGDARAGSGATPLTAVTFQIGAQEYAAPVAEVFEIVPVPALLALAGAPAYFAGLLNRRGQYLPVLDGRILVGEPARYSAEQYVIIAGRATANMQQIHPRLGLLVDQVGEVSTLEAGALMPLSSAMVSPFLRGVARSNDRSVVLFSIELLLPLTASASFDAT